MVEKKVLYVTEDGFTFNTMELALQHEAILNESAETKAKNIIEELQADGKRLLKTTDFPSIVYASDRDDLFIVKNKKDLINLAAEYFRYEVHYYSRDKEDEDVLIEKHLLETSDIDALLGFMFSKYAILRLEMEYPNEIVKHLDENGKLDLGRFK